MEEKPPRKRIYPSESRTPAMADDQAFVKNKSSDNAKKMGEMAVSLASHLWIDKHYHDRHQFGDDDGERLGIEPDVVEALVNKSIPHLVFYSTAVPGFSFLNYKKNVQDKPIKVVLKEGEMAAKLNVVIEAHHTEMNKFEITVKTAMCVEDFRLYQGQYSIEFQGDNSTMYRKNNNGEAEICDI